MKEILEKYKEKELIVFSGSINHEKQKSGKWKKKLDMPKDWNKFTIENHSCEKNHNGVFMLTGKINNIVVIDIDNIEHWNIFLKKCGQTEPETVKAISGSGGIHLYFKYDDELDSVKTTDHIFGSEFDIDIRSNNGCIIVYPSKYINGETKKDAKYVWVKSILTHKIKKMPLWMKNLLLKKETITNKILKNDKKREEENEQCGSIQEYSQKEFIDDEIYTLQLKILFLDTIFLLSLSSYFMIIKIYFNKYLHK